MNTRLTSTNALYIRKRKQSCLLLCKALGHSAVNNKKNNNKHRLETQTLHRKTHTLINVELLHKSEDMFGELLGLNYSYAMSGD